MTLCNLFGCVSAMIKSISRVGDEILQSKYNEHLVKMYSRTKGKDLLMGKLKLYNFRNGDNESRWHQFIVVMKIKV